MKLTQDIKKDIEISLNVWQNLLNEFLPDGIEYIFTKGSSVKKWESDIDYVPRISDVDIHVQLLYNKKKILSKSHAMDQSLFFTTEYEKRFFKTCQEQHYTARHLPRAQIVQLNLSGRKEYVVPPREQDVRWLQGRGTFPEEMDHEKVRIMDKKNVLEEKFFVESIPESLFDLSDLDYYTLLYKLNSRISPTPIRLLTQVLQNNPHDIWSLNKTSVKKNLLQNGFSNIASNFESYYLNGWKLFESKFNSTQLYREMINNGYLLLRDCLEAIETL